MTLFNLLEVTLKIKVELPEGLTKKDFQKVFDDAIKEIFTDRYYNKIKRRIKKVKIKNVGFLTHIFSLLGILSRSKTQSLAYVNMKRDKTIRIPRHGIKFSKEQLKELILHEFLHVIQLHELKTEFKKREFIEHSKNINRIIQENLKNGKDLDDFFSNIPFSFHPRAGNKNYELLAYLINSKGNNNSIVGYDVDWNILKPGGKKELINELKKANIFNINSKHWKKILS